MPAKKEERFNISIFISPNSMNLENDMDSGGEPDATVKLPFMFYTLDFVAYFALYLFKSQSHRRLIELLH